MPDKRITNVVNAKSLSNLHTVTLSALNSACSAEINMLRAIMADRSMRHFVHSKKGFILVQIDALERQRNRYLKELVDREKCR